jgi:aromatic-L-amino-acid/L-tryptophan decarboxylase
MRSLEIPPQDFRRLAENVVEVASQYLTTLSTRSTFPDTSGTRTEALFHERLYEKGLGAEAFRALQDVIDHSRAQNGRFFGYVLGSGEPVGALADLLASVLNQNVTAWRSAPAAVTIERTVVSWLAEAVGCPGFRGSLVGGGSAANLLALTMAREDKIPSNEDGLSGPKAAVYASEEVHMSVFKSLALLGLGRQNLRLIATDSQFRMIPSELENAIQRDIAMGRVPLAVAASAGTVNTGAIDPVEQIALITGEHKLWLHVDGAYGALASIAVPDKLRGLNLADSISLDPHKWLYQPLDCGCLLYRDANKARAAFAHTGEYARVLSSDPTEGFAFFEESIELSRRFRALRLWLSLRYHGLQAFRESITKDLELAQRLANAVKSQRKLQLFAIPELTAVCFRYRPDEATSEDDLSRQNAQILERVVHRGRVYLSNAALRGKFYLRACIVNHRTTDEDVDAVIPEVLSAAGELGL